MACSSTTSSEQRGELGNGDFSYDCDPSTTCNGSGAADSFPAGMATGGTFRVSFDNDKAKSAVRLEAISDAYIAKRGDSFIAIREGFGGIAAYDRNDAVIDYLFVKLEKPTALRVVDGARGSDVAASPIVLSSTESARDVRAFPRARDGRELGGTLAYRWQSADPGVVQVIFEADENSSYASLEPVAKGKTTVTVVGAALETTFDVEVR